ncbi:hypothetical protein CRENBAI_006302 [Crenichthys baileyi]|uniref:Uncharacterized protein n=1 Tax=Crenichthys baileyi TaxID=28760 RepID=A0AAV9RT25_9TELE
MVFFASKPGIKWSLNHFIYRSQMERRDTKPEALWHLAAPRNLDHESYEQDRCQRAALCKCKSLCLHQGRCDGRTGEILEVVLPLPDNVPCQGQQIPTPL